MVVSSITIITAEVLFLFQNEKEELLPDDNISFLVKGDLNSTKRPESQYQNP